MKYLVLVLLAVFPVTAWASDALLIPVSMPKPQFPEQLLKEKHAGKVYAHLTVGNSGRPLAVGIIESTHDRFSESVAKTLGQWRFEPWEATDSRPPELEITLPIIFGALGLSAFSPEVTVGLGSTTCAYLNYEVSASKKDYPRAPLSDVDIFWYHRHFLASSYVAYRVADRQAHLALHAELQSAVPQIVKNCRSNKDARYGDYLPEELRRVLPL